MHTNFTEAVQNQRDVLETIENVRGVKYATFVRHSYGMHLLFNMMEDDTPQKRCFQIFTAAVLTDLATALGINLNDPAVTDSLTRDLRAMGASI